MFFLRIFWTGTAFVLTVLLIAKLFLAGWLSGVAEVLPAGTGLMFFFYLLYSLEGQQVAGIQIKDLEEDAVKIHLSKTGGASKKVIAAHKIFSDNFDGFVIGRQVFTIMTVVSIATLVNSLNVPLNALAGKSAVLGEVKVFTAIVGFMNNGVFEFASATLVPAWWCQLLSQFLADGRAVKFLSLPGSNIVLRTAMLLDKIQLGEPAHVMYRVLQKRFGPRTLIPIGAKAYYDASLNFYGKGKKLHEISIELGKPSTVKESISYVFQGGKTDFMEHQIQLAAPIEGDMEVTLDLPENVVAEINAYDTHEAGIYTYGILLEFNGSLPRQGFKAEEALLEIEYQTSAYTDAPGTSHSVEFFSMLPTVQALISIVGSDKALKDPEVRVVEKIGANLHSNTDGTDGGNVQVIAPELKNNRSRIVIDYPPVATVYQVAFQTLDVPLQPNGDDVQAANIVQ